MVHEKPRWMHRLMVDGRTEKASELEMLSLLV